MASQEWAWEVLAARFSGTSTSERDAALRQIRGDLDEVVRQYECRYVQLVEAETLGVIHRLPLRPGQRIGDFELIRQVGRGAHGRVFLAREIGLDRYVALKISKSCGREGQVLAELDHPNIVRVFREQTVDERKLLVMEFVVGRTLQDWCQSMGPEQPGFDSEQLLRWARQVEVPADVPVPQGEPAIANGMSFVATCVWLVRQVGLALHHAHLRGVLHHDIKPANIIIDVTGLAVVVVALVAAMAVRWRVERHEVSLCQTLARAAEREVAAGNSSGASERVGQAKARLTNTRLISFGSGHTIREIERQLDVTSRKIVQLERQRFDSQLAEYRVATIHREQTPHRHSLIDNALKTYGVTRRSDWQRHLPFADLSAQEQEIVAENITELLIVSMWRSSSKRTPRQGELQDVLDRFPASQRDLPMLALVRQHGFASVPFPFPSELSVKESFEAYLYGVLSALVEDESRARKWFRLSIAIREPGETPRFWTHYWNGYLAQQAGDHDEAFACYGVCLGLRPDFAWPSYNLGLACVAAENFELAIGHFQRAIQLDNEFAAAYVALGAIQFENEEFAAARDTYDLAIRRGVESSLLHRNRAQICLQLGEFIQAETDLKAALDLDPANPAVVALLAKLRRAN